MWNCILCTCTEDKQPVLSAARSPSMGFHFPAWYTFRESSRAVCLSQVLPQQNQNLVPCSASCFLCVCDTKRAGTPIPDGVPLKLFASVADMVHERVGWKKPRIPGKAEQEVCPVLCPLLQMDAGAEACLYNDEPAHDVHLHRKRMHAICL